MHHKYPLSVDRRLFVKGLGAMLLAACDPAPGSTRAPAKAPERAAGGPLIHGEPESVGFSSRRLEDTFARLSRRVNDGLVPGAAAIVARHGVIVGEHAIGKKVRGGDEPVTIDTLFDVESMTKVLATAISAMVLVERGKLRLEDPAARYLPAFQGEGKEKVTVREMLRYTSGLPVDNPMPEEKRRDEVRRKMAATPLEYVPGTRVQYSDLTYRLLGWLIESAAGQGLDAFAHENVWKPLGMVDTMYNPPASLRPRVAATAPSELRGHLLRGEVQDEQDYALGGVTGCDGVFSTARDVAVFCQMILDGGVHAGARVLSAELVSEMTRNQTPMVTEEATDVSPMANLLSAPKGYGWEMFARRFSTAGTRLSPQSYGKSGGAGTFMWIDPRRRLFAVLMTNHGLPAPFDERNWGRLLDEVGSTEFYDGVVNALVDDA
jgi:CubicO group peptidase (beta-lactamase class C family)